MAYHLSCGEENTQRFVLDKDKRHVISLPYNSHRQPQTSVCIHAEPSCKQTMANYSAVVNILQKPPNKVGQGAQHPQRLRLTNHKIHLHLRVIKKQEQLTAYHNIKSQYGISLFVAIPPNCHPITDPHPPSTL